MDSEGHLLHFCFEINDPTWKTSQVKSGLVLRLIYKPSLLELRLWARLRTGLWQCFAGDDLQQEHQLQAISEIFLDVLDLSSSLSEMGVDPGSEGLQELFGTIKQNSKSTFCH